MSKRKAYRPKYINPTAHIMALHGVHILSKPDQLKQAMNLAASVSNISRTGGLKEDWMIVFDAINMLKVTDDEGKLMQGGEEFIDRCMDVCHEAMDRRKERGTLALKSEELQTLRELQTLWAQVLEVMTYADFHRLTKATAERVARALVHGTGTVVEAA